MRTYILVYLLFSPLFPLLAQSGFGEKQIIATDLGTTRMVVTADINGDGDQDVIVSSESQDSVFWFENLNGEGLFSTAHIISNSISNPYYIGVGYINNNDNYIDVLAVDQFGDKVVWYKNTDGEGTFSPAMIITTSQDFPKQAKCSDIDGDGDNDIIICSKLDNTIAWYENMGGQGNFSEMKIISTTANNTFSLFSIDIDGDGNTDIISDSSSLNNNPAWYRNTNGEGLFGGERALTNENSGTIFVKTADLDGDSDQDILTVEWGGATIAWFENLNGLGTFGDKQIITTAVFRPRMIEVGDIDNDGDIDVVSVSTSDEEANLAWYQNDGTGNFGVQIIIDDNFLNARSVSLADIDSDGYLDLVACNIDPDTKSVVWYRNQTYLGIEENPLQTITLTPNPTSGILQLYNVQTAVKKITVYDVLGKPVLQQNGDNKTIDLSSLQQGLYLIKIETATGSTVKKVVKQ